MDMVQRGDDDGDQGKGDSASNLTTSGDSSDFLDWGSATPQDM